MLPTPPVPANCPFGAVATARLPVTTLRLRTSDPVKRLEMPPAETPLASDPSDAVDPAVLSLIRVSVTVSTPPLSMPPPLLKPQGRVPQKGPGGTATRDVTVFPVITLSAIETVAPVALNGGSGICATGIQTPPPNVTSGSGLESLMPPVMVTPLIDTVSPAGSTSRKIVSTGPPPLIVVAFAPATPTRCTLTSIVMPPA